MVYTGYKEENGAAHLHVSVKNGGPLCRKNEALLLFGLNPDFERQCSLAMAVLLYDILVELTGYRPKWGVLIGVRPIKLLRKIDSGNGTVQSCGILFKQFAVSQEKNSVEVSAPCSMNKPIWLLPNPNRSVYIFHSVCRFVVRIVLLWRSPRKRQVN